MIEWLSQLATFTIAVLIACVVLLAVGYLFEIPVPFVLMTLCH